MFEPNLTGKLRTLTGRDVHARPTFAAERDCPFAPINLAYGAQPTTVRADSSASRGAAEEIVAVRSKILVPSYVSIAIGDRFTFSGVNFEVKTMHPRHSVAGSLDHFEVDLELAGE
jgi:hypothetical protein